MTPDSPQPELTDTPAIDPAPSAEPSAPDEAEQAAAAPAWQAADYTGPLDINQAAWRNRHLKPAVASVQKAAGKQGSKAR